MLPLQEVVVVGAGLAGLACAKRLQEAKVPVQVLEAAETVGGRIQTDLFDGFRLDRGFQVLLDSYPEAQAVLDYDKLQLKVFLPGALVRYNGRFYELSDPWRKPWRALKSAFNPVGSFADKLRIAKLRATCTAGTLDDCQAIPETTTLADLQQFGFSDSIIERFFRPFLGGIFLDPSLQTSNRMFRFVFRLFSQGSACLPHTGMQAIPEQMSACLKPGTIRFNTSVEAVTAGEVRLTNGEVLRANSVVIATDGPAAAGLLGTAAEGINRVGRSVQCLYFATPNPPSNQPILVLNGEGRGPINNLCVPSLVAPGYAPPGQHLVSVTVLNQSDNSLSLEAAVRQQLQSWYGSDVQYWRHLRTYTISYALPNQTPPALAERLRPVQLQPGLFLCGDHRDNASINGAMASGHRTATAVVAARLNQ